MWTIGGRLYLPVIYTVHLYLLVICTVHLYLLFICTVHLYLLVIYTVHLCLLVIYETGAAMTFIDEKSCGISSSCGIFKTFKSQENFSPFHLISLDSLRFIQTLPLPREVRSILQDLQTNLINEL